MVDLGYGASPITVIELQERLAKVNESIRVVGVEIEKDRVQNGRALGRTDIDFLLGGFETPLPPGHERCELIRAFNVLRQYSEDEVPAAWNLMTSRLSDDGVLVEGTCDEIGRIASWVTLDRSGVQSFTISLHLRSLELPSKVAERLPKVLIHRNVPGEKIHEYLVALDRAWANNAALGTFGVVQRWLATCDELKSNGWPVVVDRKRWRLGEITVDWRAVAPY